MCSIKSFESALSSQESFTDVIIGKGKTAVSVWTLSLLLYPTYRSTQVLTTIAERIVLYIHT